MKDSKRTLLDRVLAMALSVLMLVAMVPVTALASDNSYGMVSAYTGGTVSGNGTANVEVTVEETTLEWTEGNDQRGEGWWVGINVTAPEGFSEDAAYKVKTNPNAEYGAAKSFADMKDGEDSIQLWFAVSPESLRKFASEGRNLTMTYAFDWNADSDYEQTVEFSVVPSEKIVLMQAGEQVYPVVIHYGTVSAFTGGVINGNGTANVEVTVEETTLEWTEGNDQRGEGWWVGINVTAPEEGFSEDAVYKVKTNPNAEYGAAKSFADMKDGEDSIQLWFAVSPESLRKFASEGRNLTMTYAFDWNADSDYEQTVEFSVVPGEKIMLMQAGEQVYPEGYGTVSTYTGGVVSGNGTTNVKVLIEEAALEWVEGDGQRGEGWWVGINVTAPEGFSEDAAYKVKTNPNAEYGAAKSFADMKDGEDSIQLWFAVSPESLRKFASEGRNLTMNYAFDWNGVYDFEQIIEFSLVPNFQIVLTKGDEQIHPLPLYSVTTEAGVGGKLTVDGADAKTVETGTKVQIAVEADDGYKINSLKIGGQPVDGVAGTKEFSTEITVDGSNVEVVAAFDKVWTVTVDEAANGAASAAHAEVVNGGSTWVKIVPADGYTVNAVAVNGEDFTDIKKENDTVFFNIENITGDVQVAVTFKEKAMADRADLIVAVAEPGTDLRPDSDELLVLKSDDTVALSTEKDGIRVHSGDVIVDGGDGKSVTVDKNMPGAVVELYYQANGEYYADWHVVDLAIVFDEVAPENLKITYEPTFWGTLVETVTFGFYKAPVNVTVEAVDEHAGIDRFEYSYVVEDGASSINTGKSGETVNATREEGSNRYYAVFELPAQFRGKVSFTAYDKAGNSMSYADGNVVVVDSIAPEIEVSYSNDNVVYNDGNKDGSDEEYYKADRVATVTVTEANFFAQDVVITRVAVLNDGTRTEETLTPEFSKMDGKEDVYEAIITFAEEADYEFNVSYTDRSGNAAESYSAAFTIDKTAPVITIEPMGNGEYTDSESRTVKITVVEHNFRVSDFVFTVDAYDVIGANKEQDRESNRIVLEESEYTVNLLQDENNPDIWTAELTFKSEGNYEMKAVGTDLAGNAAAVDDKFCIDRSNPVEDSLKITYEPTFLGTLVETVTFGFYKAPVKVTVEAVDEHAGIDRFEYSYVVEDGVSSINTGKSGETVNATREEGTSRYYATFEIPAQFRGKVSFVAFDKAGNSASYADGNVVVVDSIAPEIEVSYSNDNVVYNDGNKDGSDEEYYKADRVATVTVTEANFFAQDVVITCVAVLNDGTRTEETLTPEFSKVDGKEDAYQAEIPFAEEADYEFRVEYTDRSGNAAESYSTAFTIDKTAPVITIEPMGNGAYFKDESRTITIAVVEHNFRASDVVFDIAAKNVIGNIGLSTEETDAVGALTDQTKWTQNGDVWTAAITLKTEGNYTIGMSYIDLAGNAQEAVISDTFCIDRSNPVEGSLKITYEPTFWGTLVETVTFGFYKAPVKVIMEAADEHAGIDRFEYSYVVEDGASSINTGKSGETVNATREDDTNRYYAAFEIPAQFRGKVSFTAYDKAGNSASYADGNVVVVDSEAPEIEVSYDNDDAYHEGYYKADRIATVTITEANFFAQDVVITCVAILNDGTGAGETETLTPKFSKVDGQEDVYQAEIPFTEEADYEFNVSYTDRSGNAAAPYSTAFTIDKTDPKVFVFYDPTNERYQNGNQFRTNREATITIVEHNFEASDVEVIVNNQKETLDWKREEGKVDTYTATIGFAAEAEYEFDVKYTDMAGNDNVENGKTVVDYGKSVAPTLFTIDKSAPTNLAIKINGESVLGSDNVVFDKFYNGQVTIRLSADFNISGVESILYQKVTSTAAYREGGAWQNYDSVEGIVVDPSEKFIIYFRAEDRAGNSAITHSTGIVVDNQKPTGEENAPEIDILPEAPNEHGVHAGDVSVTVKVVDPKFIGETATENGHYAGLNKITYRIYTTDGNEVEEGTLFELGVMNEGAEFDADNLVKAWTGNVNISASKFNSNNIIVEVTATDNSGNIRTSKTSVGDIKIDTTLPEIEVYYDNNDGDTSFADGTYFKNDRTATIVVTERNFDPELFVVEITNTDGVIPVIGDWKTGYGTGNGDDVTHTAQVVFNADGDYTLALSCVDMALNPNVEPDAGTSLAPWAFTIDKTAPVVSVTYDNNDALNGNYYKAQRTATVTVTEHNFESGRVVIQLAATDNGVLSELPAVSNWTSYGDVHTAIITYDADSRYVFDFDYVDKAGNAAAGMAEHIFYVDKTAPVLTIEKIVDESANKDEGDIGFVMTALDTNFDVFAPVLTAVIKNGNAFETRQLDIGEFTDIVNGKVFTVANLEEDGIYRITCTVVDMAGNAYSEVILEKADGSKYTEQRAGEDVLVAFSVNREGSTFEVNQETVKAVEQYYLQNLENDIVIIEINADPLKEYSVTLNGKELVKDTDYTIAEEGGNGAWMKYTYTISKELFAAEGEYKVVVYSKDKVGSDAFSDIKNATVEFVIDQTAPVVTVSGLASDGRYQTESQIVTLIPTDDGGALKTLIVNLVDETGNVVDELINLSGETLTEELANNGGMITFEVAEGLYQNVRVICTDYATGESGETNTYNETFENISVSSSVFMIFWANKPLRWGTIGGVSALVIAFAVFIILKNKKRKETK